MTFPSVTMSLPFACEAAIRAGTDRGKLNIPRWALTFKCSEEAVRVAWEEALTKLSQQAQNNCEVQDD